MTIKINGKTIEAPDDAVVTIQGDTITIQAAQPQQTTPPVYSPHYYESPGPWTPAWIGPTTFSPDFSGDVGLVLEA